MINAGAVNWTLLHSGWMDRWMNGWKAGWLRLYRKACSMKMHRIYRHWNTSVTIIEPVQASQNSDNKPLHAFSRLDTCTHASCVSSLDILAFFPCICLLCFSVITGPPTHRHIMSGPDYSDDRWRLSSSVVCNAAGGRAGRPSGS